MIRFLLPAMAVLKWRETRRVGVCSCRSRFGSSPPNGDVSQSTDHYMEPAQHGIQDVLNISTEVMDSSFWANQKKACLAYLFFLIRLSRVHRHFDDPIPSTSNGGSEMA
ncbi:hypothetical protein F2Q70_00004721 [Brassica cretica]|uniref:Uncharacterized protein n=1 Tax=Brassica cretica TaxID=69181 RepID=A0A8S9IS28_BRACR|nr:hypothetical protein F2Q70_00004721 [Brassica cretica]